MKKINVENLGQIKNLIFANVSTVILNRKNKMQYIIRWEKGKRILKMFNVKQMCRNVLF